VDSSFESWASTPNVAKLSGDFNNDGRTDIALVGGANWTMAKVGGPMSLLFAATYPQRAQALVLYGSFARHPTLLSDNDLEKEIERIDRLWELANTS
jgi:hypothetical protein